MSHFIMHWCVISRRTRLMKELVMASREKKTEGNEFIMLCSWLGHLMVEASDWRKASGCCFFNASVLVICWSLLCEQGLIHLVSGPQND